jgi:elongation factor G
MKEYAAKDIRNVAVLGHGGEGKTTLVEAMLYSAGLVDRMGRTDDGSTAMDYDPEETRRHISISMSMAPVEWKGAKVNILDIPGYFDMMGEMVGALRAAEGAVIVASAVSGLSVGAEKAWDNCARHNVARMFAVNQMDRENANFNKAVDGLKAKYGPKIAPIQLPIMDGGFKGFVDVLANKAYLFDGKNVKDAAVPANLASAVSELRDGITEAAASADEALMEKFFSDGELSGEDIAKGMKQGIANGDFIPVVCCSGLMNLNVRALLDSIVDLMPAPSGSVKCVNLKNNAEATRSVDDSQPFSALVFKTVADNFVGKISFIKVFSGTLNVALSPYNSTTSKTEKLNRINLMLGKKQIDVETVHAGDIAALIKLQNTNTGDTLSDPANPVKFAAIDFPAPVLSFAVSAEKQGEEDKVFSGLHRLAEEDPSFTVGKNPDTGETLISGQGELHLDIIASKLHSKFNTSAVLAEPRVPYRETIRKTVEAEGRHKKQTGGHGQFGHCWIRFEPKTEGEFEFADKVVGGVIPRGFIPAIEKGLRENISHGVLAGYPVVNLRCTVYDGSYHAVDSSEMAFKIAARLAFRKGCQMANPVLLEPISKAEISIPDEYMGDIIGDLNRRRGRIMGMNPVEGGLQEVVAEVPQAEMGKYATDLRSMTQAKGNFKLTFLRYEEAPANIAQKVIESAKKVEEEEEE